jgi:hypothetical protein
MAPSFHAISGIQAGIEGYDDKALAGSANLLRVTFYMIFSDADNTPVANDQAVCKTHEDHVGDFAFSVGLPGAMFFSQVDAELLTGYIEHVTL